MDKYIILKALGKQSTLSHYQVMMPKPVKKLLKELIEEYDRLGATDAWCAHREDNGSYQRNQILFLIDEYEKKLNWLF